MKVDTISQVVHAALRAWAIAHGQNDIPPWTHAPDWMQASTRASVEAAINSPDMTARDMHESWMQKKHASGWSFGETKNADARTHPLLIPFDDLPAFEKRKDALFLAIVRSLVLVG